MRNKDNFSTPYLFLKNQVFTHDFSDEDSIADLRAKLRVLDGPPTETEVGGGPIEDGEYYPSTYVAAVSTTDGWKLYSCNTAHTAGSSKWKYLTEVEEWQPYRLYKKSATETRQKWNNGEFISYNYTTYGNVIKYDNKYYRCIEDFNSCCSFSPSAIYWDELTISDWTENTSYSIGDIVDYEGTLYECRINHTSDEDFFDDFPFYSSYWTESGTASASEYDYDDPINHFGMLQNEIVLLDLYIRTQEGNLEEDELTFTEENTERETDLETFITEENPITGELEQKYDYPYEIRPTYMSDSQFVDLYSEFQTKRTNEEMGSVLEIINNIAPQSIDDERVDQEFALRGYTPPTLVEPSLRNDASIMKGTEVIPNQKLNYSTYDELYAMIHSHLIKTWNDDYTIGSISQWSANTSYSEGDVFKNSTSVYKVKKPHTSGTSFDYYNGVSQDYFSQYKPYAYGYQTGSYHVSAGYINACYAGSDLTENGLEPTSKNEYGGVWVCTNSYQNVRYPALNKSRGYVFSMLNGSNEEQEYDYYCSSCDEYFNHDYTQDTDPENDPGTPTPQNCPSCAGAGTPTGTWTQIWGRAPDYTHHTYTTSPTGSGWFTPADTSFIDGYVPYREYHDTGYATSEPRWNSPYTYEVGDLVTHKGNVYTVETSAATSPATTYSHVTDVKAAIDGGILRLVGVEEDYGQYSWGLAITPIRNHDDPAHECCGGDAETISRDSISQRKCDACGYVYDAWYGSVCPKDDRHDPGDPVTTREVSGDEEEKSPPDLPEGKCDKMKHWADNAFHHPVFRTGYTRPYVLVYTDNEKYYCYPCDDSDPRRDCRTLYGCWQLQPIPYNKQIDNSIKYAYIERKWLNWDRINLCWICDYLDGIYDWIDPDRDIALGGQWGDIYATPGPEPRDGFSPVQSNEVDGNHSINSQGDYYGRDEEDFVNYTFCYYQDMGEITAETYIRKMWTKSDLPTGGSYPGDVSKARFEVLNKNYRATKKPIIADIVAIGERQIAHILDSVGIPDLKNEIVEKYRDLDREKYHITSSIADRRTDYEEE